MRARVGLLVAASTVALVLALPASSSAAIDIVSRGFAPDPGVVNGTATLTVDVKVGQAPYIVEFICCNAIKTDTPTKVIDENSPETQGLSGTHKFTFNVGSASAQSFDRAVTVRVTDSTGAQSFKAFVFQQPTPPAPPPPPTPTGPTGPTDTGQCPTSVQFGLILARTTGGGCWRKETAPEQGYAQSGVKVDGKGTFYETSGRFVLNGVPFPAAPSGSSYVLAEPTSAAPGGQVGLDKTVEIKLGPVTVFKQPLLWKLPTGSTEGRLAAFSLPTGTLGGLPIGGNIEVLFRKRAGAFATTFPIQVTLPSIFKPSPGTVGSITGSTEISTDDRNGVSIDGGKIQIANAAIGKVALKDLCFSYLSANVSTRFAACEPPSLDGAPAVTCAPPTQQQERFDGAMSVQLPTPGETELAAYGGIAGGKFAYGGGFVDNAGIPLVAGITLERVGFGICIQPTLLLKGDAGLGFAKGLVRANASLTYAEPTPRTFFVEAAGNMSVATIPVGAGRVRVDNTGFVDFDLSASMLLAGGFIQVTGGVEGFIRPNPFAFNIGGSVSLCVDTVIFGKPCARGSAIVSNLGVGGCADFGFIGKFGGFFFWTPPRTGKRFDVGKGCGFQDRVRVTPHLLRGGGLDPVQTFPVPQDPTQYVAHFKGDGRAPKIKVTSPSGAVFQSSPLTSVSTDNKTFLIFEDEEDGETSVFLKKDAAPGDWKVEGILGTKVTDVEFQGKEAKPTVAAGKVSGNDAKRVLDLRYALRGSDTISLDVKGSDFSQVIAPTVRGAACPKGTTAPGRTAAESRCAKITWTPAFGNGGPRTIVATVRDAGGAAIDSVNVATFRQGGPKTPPKVPALRLVRKGRDVFAIWGSAGGNTTRYGAYAQLSDGRKIGHASPKNCLAWKITNVSPGTSVNLRLQAGRQDLQFGGAGSVTLKANATYAGPANLKKAPIPRPCESI